MEQRELTLAPESVGLRLDRWLAEQCPDLSRSQLQNLIEAGSVTCNGSPLNKKDKLKAGQTILLTLPDPQPIEAQPQNIPLDIVYEDDSLLVEDEKKHERHTNMYADAVFQLILAIGVGTIFTMLLTKTGLTFPIYIGAMLAAALMRNICEYTGIATIHMGEINDLGGISLSLFLGMAMITLRLWELASLALPLVILLAAQVLLIIIFTYVIEFNIMGRDYDAAILVSGTCGFGTGATPNAMANMQAVCDQYVPSIKAYLLIPLVGSLFADFLNSLVITFFINLL